jgi:TPP-dependent pyruvate/acetoin dehydrogenase alpha subunit
MIFVVENNGYAEMSPMSEHLANPSVAAYAEPHGVPTEVVDGNDVLAVREAAERAVTRARAGGGPTLIEALTYRWRGHFEGDGQKYRTKDEVAQWRERDPLLALPARFPEHAEALAALVPEVEAEMAEAAAWARSQPKAGADVLTTHVYAEVAS